MEISLKRSFNFSRGRNEATEKDASAGDVTMQPEVMRSAHKVLYDGKPVAWFIGGFTSWSPKAAVAFRLLLAARLVAALWCHITDCDETFNYWEPVRNEYSGEMSTIRRLQSSSDAYLLGYEIYPVNNLPLKSVETEAISEATFNCLLLCFALASLPDVWQRLPNMGVLTSLRLTFVRLRMVACITSAHSADVNGWFESRGLLHRAHMFGAVLLSARAAILQVSAKSCNK